MWTKVVTSFALVLCACMISTAQNINVLLFTKSSGFIHPVIDTVDDEPSVVEHVIGPIVADLGGSLTSTKDGGIITSASLAQFDVVIFFTSGTLTELGRDEEPIVGPNGVSDLIAFVEGGGGFLGLHSASDTYHPTPPAETTDYISFLGAEFDQHGSQFIGNVIKARTYHPIMIGVPDDWPLLEEWYLFRNVSLEDATTVALLDTLDEGQNQPIYDVAPYPILWTREPGDGRMAYSALAHNEATWFDTDFQRLVRNAILWAANRFSNGDTDGDGAVNASDIQRVINAILQTPGGEFAVDVNGDDTLNASDVQSVINAILQG